MKYFIVIFSTVMLITLSCASTPFTNVTKAAAVSAGRPNYTTGFANGSGIEWNPKEGAVKLDVTTEVAHAGMSSLWASCRVGSSVRNMSSVRFRQLSLVLSIKHEG